MHKLFIKFLSLLLLIGVAAIYGGIGWVIAWILELALSVNVNYTIFVLVGVGLALIKMIPLTIAYLVAKKAEKEFEKESRL